MTHMRRILVLFFALLASNVWGDSPRVSVSVNTSYRTMTCRVPRSPSNRWLDYGVYEYFSSGRQLDGDDSDPVQFTREIPALNCEGRDSVEAFCELWWAPNKYQIVSTQFPCF